MHFRTRRRRARARTGIGIRFGTYPISTPRSVRGTQGVCLMLRLRRLKAGLPGWRCEVNVDFRRRHGIGLAKLHSRLIDRRKGLDTLVLVCIYTLLSKMVVHTLIQTKRTRLKHGKRLLLLGNQAGRDVWTVTRTDVGIAVVQGELAEP